MRRWLVVLTVVALLGAGCSGGGGTDEADDGPPATVAEGDVAVAFPAGGRTMLRPFDSCDALLDHYREQALELVGPYGLGFGAPGMVVEDTAAEAADGAGAAVPPVPTVAQGGDEGAVSGTNVQEVGVDEPDLVKTDGEVIVTVAGGRVHVVDAATATQVASLPLPTDAWHHELLLAGDDLLVLSTGAPPHPGPIPLDGEALAIAPAFAATRTTLTRVDLADPADPQVRQTMRIEGAYRSARMIDGTVRLVLQSEPPGLQLVTPTDGSLTAEQEALERNRQLIRESTIDDWIPHAQLGTPGGDPGSPAPLLDCRQIAEPPAPSGLSTLAVVTLDLAGDLQATSAAGVVASGETVYASTDRLVVATSPWGRWIQPFAGRVDTPDQLRTDLHTFDITDPAATTYVASGSVPGVLLNQFALSFRNGHLRVATTTEAEWLTGEPSQSSLVVLAEDGDELAEVGRLDGLGVTERIHAVRFLGDDLAAVVTFRQTDPLYLVDLSDPAAPTLRGELHIPGYSAYLHPVADGWLLGVGQDADPETGQTFGPQVSLFDIRDLANPQRVAQVAFGEGWSPVEHDHRAFLWWGPAGRAVIPVELWGTVEPLPGEIAGDVVAPDRGQPFAGAVVVGVDGATLTEVGRITQRPDDATVDVWTPPVQRSLVIGEDLWTVSEVGLARHDLASLAREAVVPLS